MATGQSSYNSTGGTVYYDLTTHTGDRAEINEALFFQNKPDTSSGTGLIQAIVRVQDPGNGDGHELGYNTSFRPLSYEENTSPNFTTSLLLSEVPKVTIDGTDYYEFRLDINQLNSSSLLSLDEIKVFTSAVGDGLAQGTIGGAWFAANADLVYDMDGLGPSSILLDASNSSGSGSSDMFFYVPVSNFGAVDPDDTYVTLYSEFGYTDVLNGADGLVAQLDDPNTALDYDGSDAADSAVAIQGTYTANDGFEEWSVSKSTGGVISGYKWEDVNGNGQWDTGEPGLADWDIHYTIEYDAGHGHNVQHVVIDLTATTDANGLYTILVPASSDKNENYTITITEELKDGYINTYDGDATPNLTHTFNFSSNQLTLTGTPPSPNISGHFETTEEMNFGNRLAVPSVAITKDASVPGDCADTVGELITYTITVDNDGELNLTNVVVKDNFEGGGDTTLTPTGDGGDGLDPGEVVLTGDDGDGVLETNETWTYTYVRAVTQDMIDSNGGGDGTLDNTATVTADSVNGSVSDDADASVDVCQNPELSIDKSAVLTDESDCADTVGETITYTIVLDNIGNVALDNVVLEDNFEGGGNVTITPTGDDGDGILELGEVFLSGDTGGDGIMGVDETWTYTFLREVTQDMIDSNGVDNDGTLDNVATANATATASGEAAPEVSDDASVDVCQNPELSIDKTAATDGECADEVGEFVTYTVVLDNIGNVTLENVVLVDNFEGNGDVTITPTGDDGDGILELGEVFLSGDTGGDGIMGVDETWTYTYLHEVTQEDIDTNGYGNGTLDNIATANADAVTSGEAAATVSDDASADVCQYPSITLEKNVKTDISGVFVPADDPNGPLASTSSTVDFQVIVTNTGNVSLENVTMSDTVDHNGVETNEVIDYTTVNAQVDIDNDGIIDGNWSDFDTDADGTIDDANGALAGHDPFILAPGASFAIYYSLDSALGQHENTAVVDADATGTGTPVTAENDANYYVVESEDCVGVRTPGFWANNKWMTFWDAKGDGWGTPANEPKQAGTPGFADGELLYKVDSNHNNSIGVGDVAGLLIGDYNLNGLTDAGEDTLFISLPDAIKLINASSKQLAGDGKTADGIYMLGRDMVATWLNYLANNQDSTGNCIGDEGGATDTPRDYLNAAIDWMQQFASTTNGTAAQNLVNSYHDGNSQATFQFDAGIHPSSASWQNAVTQGEDIPVSAAAMHSALDGYNNTGMINGVEYCCDADSPLVLNVLAQIV